MSAMFYHKYWSIVGDVVTKVVLGVLNDGHGLETINHSLITLIPKTKTPSSMGDFKPISLCNVIYKIISKTLAIRFKEILPAVISETQSDFLSNRLITDNIIVAFELIHHLKHKIRGGRSYSALKLDMSKAFDRVEWHYIQEVMRKMGFHNKWISLIMGCLNSTSFSFMLNGEEVGFVQPTRGLRQDDSLLLCEAANNLARAIKKVLDIYNKASGQLLNTTKSVMSFSPNTSPATKDYFQQTLGMPISECHERYLGLPAFSECDKKEMFSDVKERIWQKLHAWNEKLFSVGGKEVLLKAVDGSKIHWRSWKLLCKSKFESGMGFRSFVHFNKALLAKQAWRIFEMPNSLLSRLLKHRYFSNNNFLEARLGHSPSLTWQGIHWGRELLVEGLRHKIGNGFNVLVGFDKWIPGHNDFKPINYTGLATLTIANLITDKREWNIQLLNEYFLPIDVDRVVTIPLSFFPSNDRLIWHHTTTGCYTVNSGFHLAEVRETSGSNNHTNWWKMFWSLSLPSKVKKFAWRVMQDALPVATGLCRRKVIDSATSSLCHNAWESVGHALFNCIKARKVWRETKFILDHSHANNVYKGDYLIHLSTLHSKQDFELIVCTMWAIWHERNKVIHGGVSKPSRDITVFANQHLDKFHRSSRKNQQQYTVCNTSTSPVDVQATIQQHSTTVSWTPPTLSGLKLNVDAALNQEQKILGVGAIIRNENGNVIAALSKPVQGCFRSDELEAKALFHSLNWARQLQLRITHVETDALRVSSAINSPFKNLSSFDDLIMDVCYLLFFFSGVTVSHVKRNANQAAHGLARYALELDEDVCWMGEIPNPIFSVVVNDYQF
uniref:Reverse transcriptase domain-containing protein n=1 Tax=Cannabis sativa TaxID=3483 RepID=A0A803QMZ3_CANSA